jgi:DNA repair ATPase RecN
MELNNQKNYHKQNEDRIKQLLVEISSKDEQLSLTKTELQSILDKFKQKSEEVYSLKNKIIFSIL